MTRNEIIEEIFKKQYPKKAWYGKKDSTFKDYQQEMYMILLEMPEDKLKNMYENGELDNYFYRICWNQTNKNSKFKRDLYGKIEWIPLNEDITEYDDNSGEE